jgi:NAD(P)-dependent dehydrogenase (short-subunit alcohol dehydrogenase family)
MSEPNTEAYSASKGGIIALTHALAISLGPSIRVNCISPGWIDVTLLKKKSKRIPDNHSEADHLQHPVGRIGIPADVVEMVLFLAGPKTGFITGQEFIIDGGITRKMIYV